MTSILEAIRRHLKPIEPLPSGIYHYHSSPSGSRPYRLHLRLEPDGNGLLIINASTILHLNQSAAEYAYHIVKDTPVDEAAHQIASRFRVSKARAMQDFQELKVRIQTIIESPDLDPEMYLDTSRIAPASVAISAPYRVDCALTYRLPEGTDPTYAPDKRVERELSTSEWIKIIDEIWTAGVPHVVFTGGEPTLRGDLPVLLAKAEVNGQVTGLITDGLAFSNLEVLNTLLQTGLDHIMVLLTPQNPNAWNALNNLISSDVFVAVHQTLTMKNAFEIGETIRKLSKLGVKNLSLTTNDVVLQNTLMDLRNLAASLSISLLWDLPVPYSAFNPVALETHEEVSAQENFPSTLYIEPDGDVLAAQGYSHVLGNLLVDPWDKVWQ